MSTGDLGSPEGPLVPACIRGAIVETPLIELRTGDVRLRVPDPVTLVPQLRLTNPLALEDVAALEFDEIISYLDRLRPYLTLERNEHLQAALAITERWSDMTAPLVRNAYEQLHTLFEPRAVREVADATIGIDYLSGWVQRTMLDGRIAAIRAIGARTVHIVAGNHPHISALSIVRNAITRSDAIIKLPSNDPLTATAIVRTMIEIEPEHPLTRHISVAYWKGGSEEVEDRLYRPAHIEKLIAWGGLASVRHAAGYVQPGLELLSLDPKRSATIVGGEAIVDDRQAEDVAPRLARDVGSLNQLGCVNARVVYVLCGQSDQALARLVRFGERLYDEIQALPSHLSTPARHFDPELRSDLDALRTSPDFYRVIGGTGGEGAVVVSLLDEPVPFHRRLSGRVVNLVPVENPHGALRRIDMSTQTVGVYPESLVDSLRDQLALRGAQRIVSLGHAAETNLALPQDGLEPLRRMVKWIVEERRDVGMAVTRA